MSLLYIVKTEPNQSTQLLMDAMAQGKNLTRCNLYQEQDYDKLVQLIFANEEIISWW
ncbi:MAG: hypothetical protein AB1814_05245 [Thermodesulfobacteriota bacterium]